MDDHGLHVEGPDGVTIESVPLDRDSEALAFLFRDQAPLERRRSADDLLEQIAEGRATIEFLLAASVDGVLAGVQICVRHGHSTCFVWPPVVERRAATCERVADVLLGEARHRLERSTVSMAQVMSEVDDERSADRLERNAFSYLADLTFLQRPLNGSIPQAIERLSRETYTNDNHARFVQMLDATYVGSLDCAGLDRERSTEDVLEGHRECGAHRPERWFLFRHDGIDVGVMLLTEHTEQDTWEVVYIGVHHEHRGHGYGREMLALGLREARRAGRMALLLAVDAANTPAMQTYEAMGFVPLTRRRVHVWFPTTR